MNERCQPMINLQLYLNHKTKSKDSKWITVFASHDSFAAIKTDLKSVSS